MIFFVLILGLRLQRYSTNTKRYPRKKFLETVSFVLPAKTTVGLIHQTTVVLVGRTKLKSFQKLFSGDIFLNLLNIFATAASKLTQKISKIIYSSILAFINHRNWLDDSPPLNTIRIIFCMFVLAV